jgi:hypothetical protein
LTTLGTPPFFLKYGGENNMLLNIMPKEWSGEQALHSAAQATRDGNILDLKGMCGTLVLQVTGTFSGTIVPKVSNDNVNYVERLAIDGKTGASSYSITTPGIYTIDVVGIKKFKAEITAFTAGSGSITVTALGLPITSGMGSGAANLINNIINGTAPATVTISDSNVEATNGEDAATKSNLVAGKTVGGKQVPLKVAEDGKLDLAGTPISINGNTIVAAGKITDADPTDRTIETDGFNIVSIINDGPAELILAIDESALTSAKKIYVADSEAFSDYISGTVLHYTIVNDTCTFRYVLR